MNQKFDKEKQGNKKHKLLTTSFGQLSHAEITSANLDSIEMETDWFKAVVKTRLEHYSQNPDSREAQPVHELCPMPELSESSYADFVTENNLTSTERLIIILALLAKYEPDVLRKLFSENDQMDNGIYPYGGMFHATSKQFMPSLNTAIFLLSGNDRKLKKQFRMRLTEKHPLMKAQIIHLIDMDKQTTAYNDPVLLIGTEYAEYFYTGERPRLDYGEYFPADLLETKQTLDKLILKDRTREDLYSIMQFVNNSPTLFQNEAAQEIYAPGFVVMFYGPPGTGKTMTAGLIGKECDVPVYKVDLADIISKYIGETEKNLERVFSRLEGKNVILFFDEADALFGKRTEIMDSKDKYANQEINYLLQRVERWNGIVILATNFRQNLDDAFKRRIVKHIAFEPPEFEERKQLWTILLASPFMYEPETLVEKLAAQYPFTGANIATVLKRACIVALDRDTTAITKEILNPIIRDECNQNGLMQKYVPL